MMFVFAWLAGKSGSKDWPAHLIYQTEAVFVGLALICFLIAVFYKRMPGGFKMMVAVVGGISAGFGLVMPFELAPFFFGSRGEIMMASMALILVYPFAAGGFIFLFMWIMRVLD
jgi:hypothetical protein